MPTPPPITRVVPCIVANTGTPFLHIEPRVLGAQAVLSDFLTGENMPKNIDGAMRTFHDLLDRQMKLDATASMSCAFKHDFAVEEIFFQPLVPAFVH